MGESTIGSNNPCKKTCCQCIDDSQWITLALKYFLTVHRVLASFAYAFKFHFPGCVADCENVPSNTALHIALSTLASIIQKRLLRERFERVGLVYDSFLCSRCQPATRVSKNLIYRIENVFSILYGESQIEEISKMIKEILIVLRRKPEYTFLSKPQILSLLFEEVMKNPICNKEIFTEPLHCCQAEMVLNFASTFLGKWTDNNSHFQSYWKICRLCDKITDEIIRQEADSEGGNGCTEGPDTKCTSKKHCREIYEVACGRGYNDDDRHETRLDFRAACSTEKKKNSRWIDIAPREKESRDFDLGTIKYPNTTERSRHGEIDVRESSKRTKSVERSHEFDAYPTNRGRRDKFVTAEAGTRQDKKYRRESTGKGQSKISHNPDSFKLNAISKFDGKYNVTDGGKSVSKRKEGSEREKVHDAEKTKDPYEKHPGSSRDTDDEEKLTGLQGSKKAMRENEEEKEIANLSKSKEARGGRKKKADALDSERTEGSRGTDEEGKVLKGDGKRKGRSTSEKQGTDDPDLMNSQKTAEKAEASAEDKSTVVPSGQKKKAKNPKSKKGSRLSDSSRIPGDDYSKTNGSRYRGKNAEASKLCDSGISKTDYCTGPPSPIEYQLSNEYFVSLGWTVLPATKTMRKIVQYQARMSKPDLNWFEKYKNDDSRYYSDGITPFLSFHSNGSGEVFYPNGKIAIKVCRYQNAKYNMYTVFTPGGKDSLGIDRPSQILAAFDSDGNGEILDEDGRTRLSYNQIGGICQDSPSGASFTWTWNRVETKSTIEIAYVEKSVEHLKKHLTIPSERRIQSSGSLESSKSLGSSRNKEKKVAKQKPVVEERKDEVASGSDFTGEYPGKISHVRTICMKLNEYLSLRILDRKNINLRFFAGRRSFKIELGTILVPRKEQSYYFVDLSKKYSLYRSRFRDPLSRDLQSDSIVFDVYKEIRGIQKLAKQRDAHISKYKPFLVKSERRSKYCGTH